MRDDAAVGARRALDGQSWSLRPAEGTDVIEDRTLTGILLGIALMEGWIRACVPGIGEDPDYDAAAQHARDDAGRLAAFALARSVAAEDGGIASVVRDFERA